MKFFIESLISCGDDEISPEDNSIDWFSTCSKRFVFSSWVNSSTRSERSFIRCMSSSRGIPGVDESVVDVDVGVGVCCFFFTWFSWVFCDDVSCSFRYTSRSKTSRYSWSISSLMPQPKMKEEREWKWARSTIAWTSSASDQLSAPLVKRYNKQTNKFN